MNPEIQDHRAFDIDIILKDEVQKQDKEIKGIIYAIRKEYEKIVGRRLLRTIGRYKSGKINEMLYKKDLTALLTEIDIFTETKEV
jgi:hypothetical protein